MAGIFRLHHMAQEADATQVEVQAGALEELEADGRSQKRAEVSLSRVRTVGEEVVGMRILHNEGGVHQMNKRRIIGIQFFRVTEVVDDMLRYDTAFAAERFPGIVAYPRFRDIHGTWGGVATIDRWQSFGVGITKMADVEIEDAGIMATVEAMYDHAWYTFNGRDGRSRVSLYDYVNGKKKKGEE